MHKRKITNNVEDNSQDLKIRVDEWKKKIERMCYIPTYIVM